MSERAKARWQLNLATALLFIASFALMGMSCLAQGQDVLTTARTVAGMNATELMGLIAVLALLLCGYLIRLLFGRLLAALDANAKSGADLARLLAERPCIRNPSNN